MVTKLSSEMLEDVRNDLRILTVCKSALRYPRHPARKNICAIYSLPRGTGGKVPFPPWMNSDVQLPLQRSVSGQGTANTGHRES